MRYIRYAIALVAVCALLVAPAAAVAAPKAPAPTATQITVNGTVAEQGTATPIVGATVVVSVLDNKGVWQVSATLTSGAGGAWTYGGKTGSYRFEVSAPSADPVTLYRDYPTRGTFALAVELASYGTIAGTVTDSATGLPLGGATVEFYAALPGGGWASDPAASVNALDGAYTSPQLLTGTYAVKASAAGYVAAWYGGDTPAAVTVARATTTSAIDIALAPVPPEYASISGRVVRYATETPLANAYVWFYKQNADGTWPATTPGWGTPTKEVHADALGNYTSGDLELGNYKVRFFTIHTGSQWWEYVPTVDLATVVPLAEPGQTVTGIDGWFNKP